MIEEVINLLKMKFKGKVTSNCKQYKSLASDGVHCLGYSANWVDDAEECKRCKKFIRYDETN